MEPETKKWLVIGLIVALVLIGVAVGTMLFKDEFETPAGGVLIDNACEPCTPGCACEGGGAGSGPDNQGTS